ncbi:MAG: hypothetical protein QM831_38110 [Kofleriaceae bacterium]
MKQLSLMFLVACAASSKPPVAPQPLTSLTQAELDARIEDHRLRYADLPKIGNGSHVDMFSRAVFVDRDELETLWCRPGGMSVQILTDGHFIYTHMVRDEPMVIRSPDGRLQPTPSTYCSAERYRMNLPYGGDLAVK